MFLSGEILNMFDQQHEGSEDPQIQTAASRERPYICYVYYFSLFNLMIVRFH